MFRRTTTRRHARHRYPRTALWVGGFFALAALAWMVIGVPTFVKYPTDLDTTPRYEGTFSVLVDPATGAPLAQPMEMPLDVERHIEVTDSGASQVVVRETIELTAGELLDSTQVNQYVMDRSSVESVESDRAFAYQDANVVDRSGTYRVNLPFDTSRDDTYTIYQNEIEDTYQMVPDTEDPTSVIEGLRLSNFMADIPETPLSDTFLEELRSITPLPESMTLDQLKPQLLSQGIDVDGLLAALTPVLTPEDAAVLAGFAAEPIPMDYVMSVRGEAAIEPVTGAQVKVDIGPETFAARPDMASLPQLQEVLGNYPDVPQAVQTSAALEEMANGPATPLFRMNYSQTPTSVAETADIARDLRNQALLAKVWLPWGLAGAAVLSLVVGGIVFLRRRPRHVDMSSLYETPKAPAPETDERVPVPSGWNAR